MSHMSLPGILATEPAGSDDRMRLAVLVVKLADRVKQAIRDTGEEMGLTVAQLDLLRQLGIHGPTPMSRLAETLNCDASNLTGLVDKLEGRGLLERRPDPGDRRVRVLALTEAGEQATQKAWRSLSRHCPFEDFSSEDRQRLEDLLERAF
jgi:MarR family transcriptional regulator, organic hydroperoxide resistance regulator